MPTDSSRLEIVPVEGSRRLARAFVELPYRLYRDDPAWVPPLRYEEHRRWRPVHNPSLGERWTRRFLALRDGRPVGRIAAILDADFAARWSPGAGLFGFYECADDAAAAGALFQAAESALASVGARSVIGPVNLTFHDETGILVDGFDSPPMLLSPYNPPHYAVQLAQAEYQGGREYLSYRWTPGTRCSPVVDRLIRGARADRGITRGVRVRPLDRSRWDDETRLAWEIYSDTFADVWGNTAMKWSEFAARSDRFRQFVVPELALFAERDGKAVGMALTLPDVNHALRAARGRLFPFGWLRLMRAASRLRGARVMILGVRRGETGRGVGALLAWETTRALERGHYQAVEASLVLSDNSRVQHVIDAFGCVPSKRYRLYTKTLPGAAAA
jgi:hypothetical protein